MFPAIQPQVELEINRWFLASALRGRQNQLVANQVWAEIERALKRLEKTQDWLASELEVSNNAVTKWKQSGQISRANAIAVSKLLGIKLDRLLLGDDEDIILEVLQSLPPERSKGMLHQIMYQIEHAQDVLSREQIGRYLTAMGKLVKDLDRRKKGGE